MDEVVEEEGTPITVGQQLREAREAKGLSVEDVAAATRIPTRHLSSIETSDWDKLPAATYTIGFAKNYASAVGLDRNLIGEQLRAEMGGSRPVVAAPIEYLEVTDPKRSFPKGLVFGALALLALAVIGLVWFNERLLQADDTNQAAATNENSTAPAATAPQVPVAQLPVTVVATDAVWLEIKDGQAILKQGEMKAGETFQVPANAVAPVLMTGKPEALTINVGDKTAPPVGSAGKRVKDVSLKGADLLAAGTDAPATPAATQPAATVPARAAPRPAPQRPATRPTQPAATTTTPAATAPAAQPAAPPAAEAPGETAGAN